MYTASLEDVILDHNLSLSGYADDHGTYESFTPSPETELMVIKNLENCMNEILNWMNINRLKMNPNKTEFILFGNNRILDKCVTTSLNVCDSLVLKSDCIRYLGAWFDQYLSFKTQISKTISKAMLNLFNIRSIRPYLSDSACKLAVQNLLSPI